MEISKLQGLRVLIHAIPITLKSLHSDFPVESLQFPANICSVCCKIFKLTLLHPGVETLIGRYQLPFSHWSGLPIFKQKLFQWQNCFKIIQIWIILNIQDVWRPWKLIKGQKNFEGQTKATGGKIQIFIIFLTF